VETFPYLRGNRQLQHARLITALSWLLGATWVVDDAGVMRAHWPGVRLRNGHSAASMTPHEFLKVFSPVLVQLL
jgi:hypothetical protein